MSFPAQAGQPQRHNAQYAHTKEWRCVLSFEDAENARGQEKWFLKKKQGWTDLVEPQPI